MGGEEGKDHFQRVLEAENQRAQVYLQGLEIGDAKVQGKVSRVLNSLYSHVLRSKIFSENGYLTVVDDLTRCAIEGKPLRVFGALASPTAEREAEEAEESLNRLRQFYKKQRSLITYGPIQPEFDWIMRRAVGIWASGEAQKVRSPSFMATTELNASLLPFYGTPKQLPILNLNIPAV